MYSHLLALAAIAVFISHNAALTQLGKCSGVQQFPSGACYCDCAHCSDPKVVKCERAGFTNVTLKSALTNLPASVKILGIEGDHLEELPLNIFGKKDSDRTIEVLDLSNNHIRIIHGKTFHHVKTVKNLILDNNDLYLGNHVNMFGNFLNLTMLSLNDALDDETEGRKHTLQLYNVIYAQVMKKLEHVYLNDNNLWNASLVFLHYLPALKTLELSRNKLEWVHLEPSWLNTIELMNLTNNSISGLSERSTQALDTAYKSRVDGKLVIDITDNPFHCNCTENVFIQWLKETQVDVYKKETLKCALPLNLKGRNLLSLKPEDICYGQKQGKGRASLIAVGVVIGIVGVLFLIVLFMNRKGLEKKFRHSLHSARIALGVPHNHHGYTNVESHRISSIHL